MEPPIFKNIHKILPDVVTITNLGAIPIGRAGYSLTNLTMFISSSLNPCADMFIGATIIFPDTDTNIKIPNGYLSNPGGGGGSEVHYTGEPIPMTGKAELLIAHLNASGENQRLTIQLAMKEDK